MAYKTYEDAKAELKSRLEDYLQQKGINTRKPFKCLNPAHTDNTPSMSYDSKRNKVHCFSCNADYDLIDLIQIEYGITDVKEAFKKGYEMFNITVAQNQPKSEQYTHNTDNTHNTHKSPVTKPDGLKPSPVEYMAKCHKAISKTSFLKDRGLSDKIVNPYNIGYDDNFYFVSNDKNIKNFNGPAVIIPTGKESYIARCTDKDSPIRYNKRGPVQLFNIDTCEGKDSVFIVEGEIDALSIIDMGYKAVGLGSTSNVTKFTNYVREHEPENTFILALDNDRAGMDAQKDLKAELDALKIKNIEANIYGDYKDANETLQKDKEAFTFNLKEAVEDAQNPEEAQHKRELQEYKKNYASNHIKDFLEGIRERANTPYIPTGYTNLDTVLDGGLFEGLYFIGAISSLGKTTFTLQMADQIAQQGYDVIIFSLEMARNELMAKSISRLTLLQADKRNVSISNAKTTRGITTYSRYINYNDTEKTLINEAIKSYSDYADRIIIHEGQGDISVKHIRAEVEKHIRLTGNKPVVIIDYLQIIAPYNEYGTDKQNTDKAVTELKRISRDNKLSIIAISSLNRENYSNKISMQAFKESGAIEYSSDVLIGLQFKGAGESSFDIDQAKQGNPREIELKILKNRNGSTGKTIEYKYYPMFNYYKEV